MHHGHMPMYRGPHHDERVFAGGLGPLTTGLIGAGLGYLGGSLFGGPHYGGYGPGYGYYPPGYPSSFGPGYGIGYHPYQSYPGGGYSGYPISGYGYSGYGNPNF